MLSKEQTIDLTIMTLGLKKLLVLITILTHPFLCVNASEIGDAIVSYKSALMIKTGSFFSDSWMNLSNLNI